MKLHQIRYLLAVIRNNLNITAAAERLFTSQPGISRQIQLLEGELKVDIFERFGKKLNRLTPAGEAIARQAERAMVEVDAISLVAEEFRDPDQGSLSIATTHTQARYVLPRVIEAFNHDYPRVELQLYQGNPQEIMELAMDGSVDFVIAAETEGQEELVMMPCYRWTHGVIVPNDHPLTRRESLTLEALTEYPILTYLTGFSVRSQLDYAFRARALRPKLSLTATDADVIKTYVRLGLGVGIVASMAYVPVIDTDLCLLDAGHLFPTSLTRIGFRKGMFLRGYHYRFIHMFSPHLTKQVVDNVASAGSAAARARVFHNLEPEEMTLSTTVSS